MEGNEEVKPESNLSGRNPDGTFCKGSTIGHNANPSGRPKGVPFKALLKHIAEEIAEGIRTRREVLIDDAFAMARWQPSGSVLMKLLDMLDDDPKQFEVVLRRAALRVNKPSEPVGVNRFAEQLAEQNGNGNGHSGGNGHAG